MLKWLVAAVLVPAAFSQPKWTLQYFYDEAGKDLRIIDLAFPSATRGVAVGEIGEVGELPAQSSASCELCDLSPRLGRPRCLHHYAAFIPA